MGRAVKPAALAFWVTALIVAAGVYLGGHPEYEKKYGGPEGRRRCIQHALIGGVIAGALAALAYS